MLRKSMDCVLLGRLRICGITKRGEVLLPVRWQGSASWVEDFGQTLMLVELG